MNVELSWEDMIEEEKKGFLLGYIVSYKRPNDDQNEDGDKKDAFLQESLIVGPSVRTHTLLNLRPGDYTFTVKAFTSAGEGPGSNITLSVDQQVYTLVFSILIALGTLACVIAMIVLCCSKRE
ncbi:leukemia inhibitory factor receptor-like [Colossoma macropomum]|uniref:leukemia inhibitory factor receptor-like n=1 Tax=Colossoma macropomum TaxID=42526 RepID=UPI0018651231|nr:leukemia inhibitory factor receptor-like [Colossoma macropomum]